MSTYCQRLLIGISILTLTASVCGQSTRFELATRLSQFETAWEKSSTVADRQRALTPLKRATVQFFTFRHTEAGRALDEARLQLLSKSPSNVAFWAASLSAQPKGRFLDVKPGVVQGIIDQFYTPRIDTPANTKIRLTLKSSRGKSVNSTMALKKLPVRWKLDASSLGEGDHSLSFEVLINEKPISKSVQMISITANLKSKLRSQHHRLAQLKTKDSLQSQSAAMLHSLLATLSNGATLETNYPAVQLMKQLDRVLLSAEKNQDYFNEKAIGPHWLELPTKGRSTVVRMMIPPQAKIKKSLPLVIALHGAGGSENMFFNAYGLGKIVELCKERGWILVAPRSGLRSGLIDQLTQQFPIDQKRIFLVGHSMGAAQAVRAVSENPTKFVGVAALGGGGSAKESDALKNVGFFIGIGSEDFARRGATFLHSRLKKFGMKHLQYREYKAVEHLAVVQVALPDVFKFFDLLLSKRSD